MRSRSLIAAGITLLLLSGCASRKIPQKSKKPRKASPAKKTSPARREITIAVVGDKKTRHSFRDGLLKAGCPGLLSTNSDSANERAALIATADACLIVVNCSDGPMPVNREDIQLARQFCRGRVSVAFSWTHLVADPDLYELEEIEMRDLMNAYDLPGDTAPMFFDTHNAATRLPRGYAAAAKAYDAETLRRFLAWQKGDLNEYTFARALLSVERVISGQAPEFFGGHAKRKLMNVYFLNDVALAMEKCQLARGRWSLIQLPDGTHAVMDLQDTPFPLDRAELRRPVESCAQFLNSGSKIGHIIGLRRMHKTKFLSLVPHAIRLLDSRETAYGEVVGEAAQKALWFVTNELHPDPTALPQSKAAWEKWWLDVLATEPFPSLNRDLP